MSTTTEAEKSQAIAERYARGLEALNALAECWDDDPATLQASIEAMTDEQAERVLDELSDIVGRADNDLTDPYGDTGSVSEARFLDALTDAMREVDNIGGPISAWLAQQLDLEVSGRLGSDGWQVTGAAVLMGFGGPTVRYHADRGCVEVHWWGDNGSAYVDADTLAAEIMDRATESAESWAQR